MASGAALVTGGARRLGRSIALELAQRGYDIALHYNHSTQDAEKTASEIRMLGVACELLQANLEDGKASEKLAQQAFKRFPQLNVLINNASIFERGSLLESDAALLARHMRINFEAPLLLTQAFARSAKEGNVINMVDARVMQAKHSHVCYLLSKKALYHFTQMAAVELAPRIRVNGVCPGFVLPSSEHEKDYEIRLKTRLPLQEIASVQDVVQAIFTLLESPSMTGQFLYVDGGESLL